MQKEINKFLKKINVEKLKKNHKECIELYNIVGGLYSEVGSYDEAIHYHEQALDLCKTIGDRLGTAVAYRYIGEAKAALGNFFQAIDYIKKYLDLAEKTSNQVEKQRAWTTLGRIYLMQAQDMKDRSNTIDNKTKDIAREAELRFQTALRLAEQVSDRIDAKEYAQMRSGLLINLGLVKDICGPHDEAVAKFKQAIKICKEAKLKEDLFRCQIILAGIFRQRMKDNDIKMAVMISEEALQTAKSIGRKLLICDALLELGLVRICQRNFKDAKRTFVQAYLEKSPNEEDHAKAIKLTKLSHLIYVSHEKFRRDDTPSETRLKLCDKLGDLFVAINNYKLAVDYYKKALDDAIVCAKPKNELARILYSLAETYADDGQFESALKCYKRELSLRNGNNNEQCQSLIKIAHMHEYLNHESEEVCGSYEKALEKAGKTPKLMHNVLRYYVPYMKQKSINASRCKELEDMLLNLKSYPEVIEEIENEDYEEVNDLEDEIANIDDIISDDEDNNEVLMIGKRKSKGSGKFKPNEVGDTPLHEACIKGDLKRVKWLIDQGHEVNPRDNAGWIPLHEACNHGHFEIAEYLIEHGADVNNRGLKGMSPLHDAATNGHFEIMRLLIKNGANAISLTDTGETVLSCLRDYKKRNYSSMSNTDLSEYKYMEAELLNVMDKCGFNLMSENIKNLGTRVNNPSSSSALKEEIRPKPRNLMGDLERPVPNPVKDYKDVIGTLKRKRLKQDEQDHANKKVSQPATYHSSMSTSASTKEWLIDDVSRQKQIITRRSNLVDLFESDDEFSDDEVKEISSDLSREIQDTNKKASNGRRSCDVSNHSKKVLLDSDDEEQRENSDSRVRKTSQSDEDVLFISEESPNLIQFTPSQGPIDDNEPLSKDLGRISSASLDNWSFNSTNCSNLNFPTVKSFDLLAEPLVVTIEERKLLIPIKDEHITIKELKKLIVDRYSYLVNAEPKISLAPCSDPSCILFDSDLCKDVIRENVMAIIDSWQLESIEESYVKNCSKINLEPLTFIKIELRGIEESGNKLDLSYMRFPKAHLRPMMLALTRREFTCANFTGSAAIFECQKIAQNTLETITSWNKLIRLNLRCIGLMRAQFETICSAMTKLPELLSLDVSVNSIVYKNKLEFINDVEKLRLTCPKLKSLDIRRNHLQFVKSIISDLSSSTRSSPDGKLDISKALNMVMVPDDMEIFGSDQNEYSVYSC